MTRRQRKQAAVRGHLAIRRKMRRHPMAEWRRIFRDFGPDAWAEIRRREAMHKATLDAPPKNSDFPG